MAATHSARASALSACDQKAYQGYHMFVPATSMPQTCALSNQDYHMTREGFGRGRARARGGEALAVEEGALAAQHDAPHLALHSPAGEGRPVALREVAAVGGQLPLLVEVDLCAETKSSVVSTRILGRRTAPITRLLIPHPRPTWFCG